MWKRCSRRNLNNLCGDGHSPHPSQAYLVSFHCKHLSCMDKNSVLQRWETVACYQRLLFFDDRKGQFHHNTLLRLESINGAIVPTGTLFCRTPQFRCQPVGVCMLLGTHPSFPLLGRTNGITLFRTVLPSNMFETTAA